MTDRTFRAFLARNAHKSSIAVSQKRYAIWHHSTWHEIEEEVNRVASGMQSEGLNSEERVGLLSDPRKEWVIAYLALIRIGAQPVLLSPLLPYGGVVDHCTRTNVNRIICEDQEQVDKVRDAYWQLAHIKSIHVFDPKGIVSYQDERIHLFDKLASSSKANALHSISKGGARTIVFSAGQDDKPRPIEYSETQLIEIAEALIERCQLDGRDRHIPLLPLSILPELVSHVVAPLVTGANIFFAENGKNPSANLPEVAPTIVTGLARVWDKLFASATVRTSETGKIRRALIRSALKPSSRNSGLWRALIKRPILSHMGLSHTKIALSYGASPSPSTFEYFGALGLNLRNAYSNTDLGGLAAIPEEKDHPINSIGTLLSHLGRAESSGAAFKVRSDALGNGLVEVSVDDQISNADDHLVFNGRLADEIQIQGQPHIHPHFSESALRGSEFVRNVVVMAKDSNNATALIEPDFEYLENWAESTDVVFTTREALVTSEDAFNLYSEIFTNAMDQVSTEQRVTGWNLLPDELDPANGELTSSLSIRRRNTRNRYARFIDNPIKSFP